MTKLPFFFFSQVQWLKMGCWISTNPYYNTQTNKQTKLVGMGSRWNMDCWRMYKPNTKPMGNVQTWYKAKPPTTAVPWQLKVQSKYQINTKPQQTNIRARKGHAQWINIWEDGSTTNTKSKPSILQAPKLKLLDKVETNVVCVYC